MADFIDTFPGSTLDPHWQRAGSPTSYVDGQLHLPLSAEFDFTSVNYPSVAYAEANLYSEEYVHGTFRTGYLGVTVTLPTGAPLSTRMQVMVTETNRSAVATNADAEQQGIHLIFQADNPSSPGTWQVTTQSFVGGATLAAESHDFDPAKPHYLLTETADRVLITARSADGVSYENATVTAAQPWMGFPGSPAGSAPAATDINLAIAVYNGADTPSGPYEYLVDDVALHFTLAISEVSAVLAAASWNVQRNNIAGQQSGGRGRFMPI